MKENIQLAWRNLWRNKRRTILTIASVFFAVFLALLMRSMQIGSYGNMIGNTVKNSTGYIQVQAPGYWDDKTINNTFESSRELEEKIQGIDNISGMIPRLESFALASSGLKTKGIGIIGTDPVKENQVTGLMNRVIDGDYFNHKENQVLVAEKLASYLEVGVGDSIVLLSQGYHGITAAGEFHIIGIVNFPSPEMNSQLIYMTLNDAQYFYAAPSRLTSLSIMLTEPDNLDATAESVRSALGDNYDVMTWEQMLTALVQAIESDNVSGWFMLGILYMVVAFGIFGTMLMMTMERKREFAVLVSIGMQRFKLARILTIETIFIALIGTTAGIVLSLPVVFYFNQFPIELTGEAAKAMMDFNVEPVMPFAFTGHIFFQQTVIVLILTLIAALYPISYVHRFNVLRAFRGK
jgi:ABC-type lipoprotein release transport system permease subunit